MFRARQQARFDKLLMEVARTRAELRRLQERNEGLSRTEEELKIEISQLQDTIDGLQTGRSRSNSLGSAPKGLEEDLSRRFSELANGLG